MIVVSDLALNKTLGQIRKARDGPDGKLRTGRQAGLHTEESGRRIGPEQKTQETKERGDSDKAGDGEHKDAG